jgi:hypothetical protein
LSSRIKLSPRRAAPADGLAEAIKANPHKTKANANNFFKITPTFY